MDSIVDLPTLKKFISSNENNKNFKLNNVYLIERIIYLNDNKALEYLLSQNVNILIPKLMEQPIKFNNKEIINTLINYSSQAYEIVDNKKHNAFHYAIKYSNDYVIDLLIDKINIQTKDFKNNNYLHYSIKHHNIYSFNKLINLIKESNNYDIFNQTNNNGDTPLILMITNNIDYDITDIINHLQVNLNIQNNNYDSLITLSITNQQLLNSLLKTINYVNWNLQDHDGNTIIHLMIINKQYDLLKSLLNKININYNIFNINYQIPLVLLLKQFKNKLTNDNKELLDNFIINSNLYIKDSKGNCSFYYLIKYYSELLTEIMDKNTVIINVSNNKNVSLKDIDKKSLFKYKEIEHKQLQDIKYSTCLFDILCGMSILDIKGCYVNYRLDELVIEESLNDSLMKLFMIWDGNLINKEIMESIDDFNKSDKDVMVIFLLISTPNTNHANIILISKQDNIVYRYDPYGYYYHDKYGLKELDNALDNEVNNINQRFKLSYDYFYFDKMVGNQQIEKYSKHDINDLNGFCVSWCILMALNVSYNVLLGFNILNVVDILVNLYDNIYYRNYCIKQNQETINKLRDIVINKVGVKFVDYINDDISVEDGNKMIKELNNVIELFNKSISKVSKD